MPENSNAKTVQTIFLKINAKTRERPAPCSVLGGALPQNWGGGGEGGPYF